MTTLHSIRCIFCRRSKILLSSLGIAEAHVDVDAHGGASSVVGQLAQAEDYPLKGIPVIFEAVDAAAAVTVKYDRSQLKKVSKTEAAAAARSTY